MTDLAAGRITAVMMVTPVAAWLAAKRPDLRIVAQVSDDPQPLGIARIPECPFRIRAGSEEQIERVAALISAWSIRPTSGEAPVAPEASDQSGR